MVAFAAIPASGRPWARIVSCNPCEVKDELIPPVFSGYPTDDMSDWSAFWSEYDRVLGPQIAVFDAWLREHGGPPLPGARDYMYESPFLNLYLFPEATDYRRETELLARPGTGWTRACGPIRRSTWTPRSPAPRRSSTSPSARSDRPTSS